MEADIALSEADIALMKKEAAELLERYAKDEKVIRSKRHAKLKLVTPVFKSREPVIAEKMKKFVLFCSRIVLSLPLKRR